MRSLALGSPGRGANDSDVCESSMAGAVRLVGTLPKRVPISSCGESVSRARLRFSLRGVQRPAINSRQIAPLRFGQGGAGAPEARLYLHVLTRQRADTSPSRHLEPRTRTR